MLQIYKTYIGIYLLLFAACTFDTDNDDPLIITRIGNLDDTVSIWPQLTFLFSVPLEDNIVNIQIIPNPGPVYNTHLSDTKDTVTISVTGALEGNTSYTITPKNVLTAENGNQLYPSDAVFNITTYPREYEPNNSSNNADTLSTVCFGILSPAHDTDYFFINDITAKTLYLMSHNNKAGYIIKDSTENTIASDDGLEVSKTLTIGDSISLPIVAGIFSLFGTDTRYEIGIRR